MESNIAIILAGGSGSRFDSETPKQFLKLAGKPIIVHTLEKFQNNSLIHKIIIVSHESYIEQLQSLTKKFNLTKVKSIISGGTTRQESSHQGLLACCSINTKKVLIHDAVRPFVSDEIISNSINELSTQDAIDVAIACADTIIKVSDGYIDSIPKREFLMRGQTPQGFNYKKILEAHNKYESDKSFPVTDDCGLYRHYFEDKIKIIAGEQKNIKITYPEDLVLAEKLFQLNKSSVTLQSFENLKNKTIVILGGNSGIGEAIAQLASKNEAKVFSTSRREGVDITNSEDVRRYLAEVSKKSPIDAIINTAGVLEKNDLKDRDYKSINEEVSINYLGSVIVAKESYKYLKEKSGHLLLFTSSSYTRGRPGYSIYSSTKAAIVNLAQAVAAEFLESNIKVNVICPERTKTPMRIKNFGIEPEGSLMSASEVAKISLSTILSDFTSLVIDAKRDNR